MVNEFKNANLRGKDLRGKNFTGVDFSHADIRGANFSNAILVNANFSYTTAGLPIFHTIGYVILSLIVSLLAGLIAAYAGAIIGDLLSGNANISSAFGIISALILLILLITILWQGLGLLLATLAEVLAACSIIVLAFLPENDIGNSSAVAVVLVILAMAGSIVGVVNMALALAIARVIIVPGIVSLTGVIAVLGAVVGALLGVRSQVSAYLMAGLVGVLAIAIGIYVGREAINGNQKYLLIRSLAISIVSQGGTSFHGANLTDANFTQANLKSVDFRQATLTRICWLQTKNLAQARLEGTYLENPKLRQLVVTKEGREQNFDRLNLREINLENANLQDTSFIGTDLSEANLQNANLTGAKLAQAQLYQTILNQACLTGAYIQNWGISTNTQLEAIKCDYIYMQLPTKDDPDPCRKPDNRREIFQPGDFAEFIAPIIKTLNLYQTQNIDPRQVANKFKTLDLFHYEGIDPTAAAIAVTQLAENHPEAGLEIVALEGRGKDKIRLQAIVANDANRSELYQEYFKKYTEIQSLPYSDLQALLLGIKEKEERIQSLEKLLENAIHQPKFYVETYQNQGEIFMSQSKGNVNISGSQGNISGISAVGENSAMTGVAIGAISGNVTNTINELPPSSEPDKPGIKELLTELQAAIEADNNLEDEDKAEALEQIKAIAEAGQSPEDGAMQKAAKTALKFLKGTIADLPATATLVEACSKLLPLITKFFGLP